MTLQLMFACLFAFLSSFRSLILTNYWIGKLGKFRIRYREKTHPCSEYVILAAYSSAYDCLVTVGNSSTIAVWEAASGSLIYEYEKSHFVLDTDGMPQNLSIMAAGLDPSQRRLITAGEITDIYDNGSDDVEPVIWEKRHKKSVVSLDTYRRNLVASATCDADIIVWLRKSKEPKVQLKDLDGQLENDEEDDSNYLAKTEVYRRRKYSVSQLLFLQTRAMDYLVGNLVSCGMDGRIRFWNIVCTHRVNEGKLLTKFKAAFRECYGILFMASDTENHYLISGDSMGYIRVYEMDGYYDVYGSAVSATHKASPQQMKKFPFLRLQENMLDLKKRHPEYSKFSDEPELGIAPFLLNCFRAHLEAVLKVNNVSETDILITAGKDNSVWLWTISGLYVGRLGPTDEPWSYALKKREIRSMAPDVKLVASSLTLFVMNNGSMPHWTRALQAIKRCRLRHQPEGYAEKMPFSWKSKEFPSEDLTTSGGTLEEEISRRLPYLQSTLASKQDFSVLNKIF